LPISSQYSRARKTPAIHDQIDLHLCESAMSGTGSLQRPGRSIDPCRREWDRHLSLPARGTTARPASAIGFSGRLSERKHPSRLSTRANALGLAARVRDDRRGPLEGQFAGAHRKPEDSFTFSESWTTSTRTLLRSTSSSSRRSLTGASRRSRGALPRRAGDRFACRAYPRSFMTVRVDSWSSREIRTRC